MIWFGRFQLLFVGLISYLNLIDAANPKCPTIHSRSGDMLEITCNDMSDCKEFDCTGIYNDMAGHVRHFCSGFELLKCPDDNSAGRLGYYIDLVELNYTNFRDDTGSSFVHQLKGLGTEMQLLVTLDSKVSGYILLSMTLQVQVEDMLIPLQFLKNVNLSCSGVSNKPTYSPPVASDFNRTTCQRNEISFDTTTAPTVSNPALVVETSQHLAKSCQPAMGSRACVESFLSCSSEDGRTGICVCRSGYEQHGTTCVENGSRLVVPGGSDSSNSSSGAGLPSYAVAILIASILLAATGATALTIYALKRRRLARAGRAYRPQLRLDADDGAPLMAGDDDDDDLSVQA